MRNLSHVMLVEVERKIGTYSIPEVILFNINHTSEDEAYKIVASGLYDDSVLCIPKSQWVQLFCNGSDLKKSNK